VRKIILFSLAGGFFGFLALFNPVFAFGAEKTIITSVPVTPLSSDILFTLINNHRATLKLSAFIQEEKLCLLASERAPEIYNEIYKGRMHSGLYNRNLPYWITENIINHTTEQSAFQWWMNSRVHRNSIEGNYIYSCGACSGKSCVQLFTNYTPKFK
jgi:hypothetical protein